MGRNRSAHGAFVPAIFRVVGTRGSAEKKWKAAGLETSPALCPLKDHEGVLDDSQTTARR